MEADHMMGRSQTVFLVGMLFSLLFLCSCFSQPALMTFENFDSVELGTPIAEIQSRVGEPYAIHDLKGGGQEFEYIERLGTGVHVAAENHYYLIVEDGKITGKYMRRGRPPPYDLIYQDQPNYYPEFPGSSLLP
jgi:hypothetical protein